MSEISIPLRKLGRTDIDIPVLSLGSWNTYGSLVEDAQRVQDIVSSAYGYGIRFFDTANNYAKGRAEQMLGEALQSLPRESFYLSSKVYMATNDSDRGLSREQILRGIEGSLRRLGTEYLDIYFCHRFDPNTPLQETIATMDELIKQGLIRYWGTSTWTTQQLRYAFAIAERNGYCPPSLEQPELNLVQQLRYRLETLPMLKKKQMGAVTFSPLASGLLTGKYDDGIPEDSRLATIGFLRDDLYKDHLLAASRGMKEIAQRLGCSRAQLAIAWVLRQPGVSSVITGASSLQQLEENLGALNVELDQDAIQHLETLFTPGYYKKLRFVAKRWLRQFKPIK
ncbi:aldo/keto reductase [Kaarinaea lacus]